MTFARRILLITLALLLVPAPARADPPSRLATQVTDTAGALGGDRARVDAALSSLQQKTGIQLFVVYVDSFDGTPAQEWTEQTARLSDLGDRDALLAVATGDRAYWTSPPQDSRLSDAELRKVEQDDIEPALSRNDWAGAVVAAAAGYEKAAGGGSASYVWIFVILAVVIAGGLLWVFLRRRRTRPVASAQPEGPPTADLTAQANALLIELDDDLRASESELGLATAQYGEAETSRFRAALEASRQDVAEAFRLRMTLEEEPAPDEETRRRTLTEIIARCRAADERLDAESEAFDRLRDLEGRAAEVAAQVDQRRLAAEATLPEAAAVRQELLDRYDGQTVTGISGNVDQARERLQFVADALERARAALASVPASGGGVSADSRPGAVVQPSGAAAGSGGAVPGGAVPGGGVPGGGVPGGARAEAALAVRAAEQAVGQAEQLVAAVHRASTDLVAARSAADALIAELEVEIAAGRAAITSGGGGGAGGSGGVAGLGAAVAGAEQAVAEARTRLTAVKPDPIATVAVLQTADTALDRALAEARDAAERAARARSVLAQALPVARAEVAAATDFISTRRGVIDADARAALSEAQRHLALAESLAGSDPATAVAEAQQAQQHAAAASQAAHADVQSWGGYGPGGYGSGGYGAAGFDPGAFAGAVLGGILAGGGRSRGYPGGWSGGGSGGGGGWSGGGFGGSASRGRRTGGGGRF
ncbi:TPM domain-containing protein [Couchioplanes caeruleus]|uniref:TPM domain-containing protein n=1 Tax=Couchioplanes caeruleus TaxID=56438 RepID=UPI0020BFF194|nr:TPM domain-containing protein [Couchioplanes caeruleus]UQU63806.1 TPM domain-containing protein [Couchioplanes caeruleus]